jgi:hypothetical protein
MINFSPERGNCMYSSKYNDNLNIVQGNLFLCIYFIVCKWPVYYI